MGLEVFLEGQGFVAITEADGHIDAPGAVFRGVGRARFVVLPQARGGVRSEPDVMFGRIRFTHEEVHVIETTHVWPVFVRRFAPNEDWWRRRESKPFDDLGEISSESDIPPTESEHNANSSRTLADSAGEAENAQNDTPQTQPGQNTDTSTGEIQVTCRSRLTGDADAGADCKSTGYGDPPAATRPGSMDIPDDLQFIMAAWNRLSAAARARILDEARSELERQYLG